ncbi:hypothetical protein [Pseudomonas syringae]|uniref:hypothetical protein n=1 Tax=Pseudomonas syringae TaxID=317 RepID=UPI001F1BCCE3|nr:hypothetical protein [Pseudomonas syringae]MCF5244499.1 hypothetical protein [Pseudomonas syringae]
MNEFVEVKTAGLVGAALDWAVLTAIHGQGQSWAVVDGVFGTLSIEGVRAVAGGIERPEVFHAYQPTTEMSTACCLAIVDAGLGETVSVPKELLS